MHLDTNDNDNEVITFRVRDASYLIAIEGLVLLLDFDLEADVYGEVNKEEIDSFWIRLSEVEERKRRNIQNPAIQVHHRQD